MANHTATGSGNVAPNGTVPGAEAGAVVRDRLADVIARGFGSFVDAIADIGLLVLVVILGYAGGRLLGKVLRWSIRHPPTSRDLLLGKLIIVLATGTALGLGVSGIYDLDLFSLFATLGIISLALGFGLQNTVANLAAGVGLTFDRPFDVGDRIRVGQTWGDVLTIGLRSTSIRTTSGEHVVVPNALLDTQEVWNFTHADNTHMRLELPVAISYESSYRLAEKLMLDAAKATPGILNYPEPHVRLRNFGADSLELELRVWVEAAPDKAAIQDRLLRRIKDAFDREGVAIPYPQRTVHYATDLPAPSPTPPDLAQDRDLPTVMVCTRGAQAARDLADLVVSFAVKAEARLAVLVVRASGDMNDRDAEGALDFYMRRAARVGVPAKPMLRHGDFMTVFRHAVNETGASLIIMGRNQGRLTGWLRNEVTAARRNTKVPVLLLDAESPPNDELVQFWRSKLHRNEEDDKAAGSS